ncbi:MAG TPA: hypothetical protein PLZ27_05720 [Bacillota bacterium]|nr:hypothetical protein [Bacillota bacterium]HPU18148.1 hypothetical protein [Bacillota bacterium]
MAEPKKDEGKYLYYKGLPLVREGNVIYYGNMDDDYVLLMTIMTTKKYMGRDVPDMIVVQILSTKEGMKIVKQDVKHGFYEAFDTGVIWLERMLAG